MKSFLLISISILIVYISTAQTYSDVTIVTPNQTTVQARSLSSDDLTTTQKNDSKNFWLNCYNNEIIYKSEATYKYNCHAFAWYVSEGGNQLWINSPNDDKYWEDASYIETTTQSGASKVSYGGPCDQNWTTCFGTNYTNPCDHSAITTTSNDYFISKWGSAPRFEHHKDDCPYSVEDLHYYAPFSVTNPDYVCYGNNATFTTPDYENCTFTWTYDTNLLNYVAGQGTKTFKVTPKNSTSAGMGWVKLTLTITTSNGNVTRTMTKNIGVNRPHYEDLELALLTTGGSPASYMCPNTHYHIFLNNSGGCSLSNYDWLYPSGWSENYTYNNMISVYTGSSPGGMVEVYADACNGINSKVITDYFGSGYCGGYYSMSFTPNPTTGETRLTIEPTSEEETFDETIDWELEVYSPTQTLKEKKTKLKGSSTAIQTHGWKEGVYVVRVKYKDEILTGKLVVKK